MKGKILELRLQSLELGNKLLMNRICLQELEIENLERKIDKLQLLTAALQAK